MELLCRSRTPGPCVKHERRVRQGRRWLRRLPRRASGRLVHAGNRVSCPCCGSTYAEFAALHGPDRLCWHCGSLERDRLLWLFFDLHPWLLRAGRSVLHIAPEESLRPRLERDAQSYVCGDLTGAFGDTLLDITELPFRAGAFDAVMCNHVLEHVADDRTAMRELRRVLAPDGWAVLLVPDVATATTIEDPSVTDPAERLRRFGQEDHLRRYGFDYLDRLREAGFDPQVVDMAAHLSETSIARHRLRKFSALEPVFLCR